MPFCLGYLEVPLLIVSIAVIYEVENTSLYLSRKAKYRQLTRFQIGRI